MCGIAGIMNKQKKMLDGSYGKAMNAMLQCTRHRGPDDSGICNFLQDSERLFVSHDEKQATSCGRGILGFNRLSIQDLSEAGHQPMISPNGKVVLTFNGEIYNVQELRTELLKQGVVFRGHSDTEVILHLYLQYGFDDMIRRLNGMFAIALIDGLEGKLYLARDRFGIIPLYITENAERLAWASEMKAFSCLPDFRGELDMDALSESLTYIYPTNVLYKNVESFQPGTYCVFEVNGWSCKTVEYFNLDEYSQLQTYKERNLYERLKEVLQDCAVRQMISDVKLGVQFSGGIDSTLLAYYVDKLFDRTQGTLCGFSLFNSEYSQCSEEKWIHHAADRLDLKLNKYDMTKECFAQNYEKALFAFERVVSVPSPMGIYEFSKHAKKAVTVLISGEGADELCGGYEVFSAQKALDVLNHVSAGKLGGIETSFFVNFDKILDGKYCKELYNGFSVEHAVERRRNLWDSLHGTRFDKLRKLYFQESLITLLERQNKICMANSVENRVPFLDNEMVAFCFRLPEKYLLHPQYRKTLFEEKGKRADYCYQGKYWLKKLSAEIYGPEFAYRKKQAIRVPMREYIKSPGFEEYMYDLILPGMRKRGLFNMDIVARWLNDLDHADYVTGLWKAINIEAWCQLFLDGRECI